LPALLVKVGKNKEEEQGDHARDDDDAGQYPLHTSLGGASRRARDGNAPLSLAGPGARSKPEICPCYHQTGFV